MKKKVILLLALSVLCIACSDDGRKNDEMQSGLESSICKGGDTVVEVGDEESNCFTVTPNISPTSTAIEYTKLPLSERIVVKRHGGDIEEEDIFLYRIKHDKKYGVVNQYGEVVVEPVYEYMDGFCEGYAVVYQDKKYGYIDENGNLLTEIAYDGAKAFSEGLAVVQVGGLYGFIDTTGQFVIEPQYIFAHSFSDGLAAVKKTGKENSEFISPDGVTVFENFSKSYGDFHNGLARVRLNHLDFYTYGYMDKTGRVVIGPITDGLTNDLPVNDFSEGFGIMYIEKDTESAVKVYVNTEGEILGEYEFFEAFDFSEGLAYAERDGICGYIDNTGEFVIIGVSPSHFAGGLAACRKDGKMGFIDKTGEFVIEPIYDDCYYGFGTEYAVVSLGEELICINKSGEEMWRLLPEE